MESVKKIVEKDIYINRINELNYIIGDLNKENIKLKNIIDEYQKIVSYIICKYTPFMIATAINHKFPIKINSRYIVKVATNENMFESDYLALRIPRKKKSAENYASTVVFSLLGFQYIIDALIKKGDISPRFDRASIQKSIEQMNNAKLTQI